MAERPTLLVEFNDLIRDASGCGYLVRLGQQAVTLWVDTLVRCVTYPWVFGEVSIDCDAIAGWALIDVVLEVHAVALAFNMFE